MTLDFGQQRPFITLVRAQTDETNTKIYKDTECFLLLSATIKFCNLA